MVRLSIITVNRNNAAGLEKTLQSVWEGQSFSDFEHIVIDGGSADGSVEVIGRYADKLAYWVSEPDKGIYNAMNKGVRKACGEYVLFLNSGDWLRADALAKVFGGGKRYAEDIVYGDLFFYYSPADVREYVYPDSLSVSFLLNYSLGHPSTFIRRSLFEKTPYNENYRIVSDWAFWVEKILLDACTTRHIRVGVTYFDTSGVSSVPDNQKLIEAEKADFLQKRFPAPIRNLYAEYEKLYRAMDVISKHRTEELAGSAWMQRKLRAFVKLLFKLRKLLNK